MMDGTDSFGEIVVILGDSTYSPIFSSMGNRLTSHNYCMPRYTYSQLFVRRNFKYTHSRSSDSEKRFREIDRWNVPIKELGKVFPNFTQCN